MKENNVSLHTKIRMVQCLVFPSVTDGKMVKAGPSRRMMRKEFSDESIAKMIMQGKVEGSRGRGRPPTSLLGKILRVTNMSYSGADK